MKYVDPTGYTTTDNLGRTKIDRWGMYIPAFERSGGMYDGVWFNDYMSSGGPNNLPTYQQRFNLMFWKSITRILMFMGDSYTISVFKAFGEIKYVGHFGPLGQMNVWGNGAIFFENVTAGMHQITWEVRANKFLVNPTGMGIRSDAGGDGHWGASRGNRPHRGIDFSSSDGQRIVSPIDGKMIKSSFINQKGEIIPTVVILPFNNDLGFDKLELLYVGPAGGDWIVVAAGDVVGYSINLQQLGYPDNVGPHIHLQLKRDHVPVNPTNYFNL